MFKNIYNLVPLQGSIERLGLNESSLARASGLSRLTIRSLSRELSSARVDSVGRVAAGLGCVALVLLQNPKTNSDYSVQAACFRVLRDGDNSWKIHFMDFVDEFRRSLDTRLIVLPPPAELPLRLRALMASMVCYLCRENQIDSPSWASQRFHLDKPWFVSESEALKPMMLIESPLEFRRNLIFVGENILDRT